MFKKLIEREPYVQRGTYRPGEVPTHAFCESVAASSLGAWHIRRVTPDVGLKLGGGIDTDAFCGHPKARFGWDVNVKISEQFLAPAKPGERNIACPRCVEAFRADCAARGIVVPKTFLI